MTSAAIYARFSTDKQDATSIEDQTRVCRARAEALGFTVVATYSDPAVSGAIGVLSRPGGAAMHAAAMAKQFDVLIIESLDRLSRDSVDGEAVIRRLEHRGIRIIGCSDSYDSNSGESRRLVRGMRGLVNEIYRSDLPHKTRRGLAGQVERGFHAGGLAFGYRSVAVGMNARGDAEGFRLEIDEAQAEVVRKVYRMYADGMSCQAIAAILNAQGVRGPGRKKTRPSTWSVSALYGTPSVGSGILNNELYIGRYVWNRREWRHDPDQPQRRIPRMRPRDEWKISERPDLRIVDDELWQAVRKRMGAPRMHNGRAGRGARPSTLFGGLLRCGLCGGAVVAVSAREYGCAARKDRGTAVCPGVRAPRDITDRRLVSTLRDEVTSPEAVGAIVAQVKALLAAAQKGRTEAARARREREARLRSEIDRLVDSIAVAGHSAAILSRLAVAEAELASLSADVPVPRTAGVHVEAIRAKVLEVAMRLETALAENPGAAREILGDRLGPIVVTEKEGTTWAEMQIGPALLLAGEADSRSGCGGRI